MELFAASCRFSRGLQSSNTTWQSASFGLGEHSGCHPASPLSTSWRAACINPPCPFPPQTYSQESTGKCYYSHFNQNKSPKILSVSIFKALFPLISAILCVTHLCEVRFQLTKLSTGNEVRTTSYYRWKRRRVPVCSSNRNKNQFFPTSLSYLQHNTFLCFL